MNEGGAQPQGSQELRELEQPALGSPSTVDTVAAEQGPELTIAQQQQQQQ